MSLLNDPTAPDKLNHPSNQVVIPFTHAPDTSLFIPPSFPIANLTVPATEYLSRLLAALLAVSVSCIFIILGVPVVFHISDIDHVVCEFVPVRLCVALNDDPFVTFITHCVPTIFPHVTDIPPAVTAIPAIAVYNPDDVIVPVAILIAVNAPTVNVAGIPI